ncbi:MAG: hypothetical protein Q8N99_04025 [Nanoarchaeota archaeon]|nr:hypothetical protein [Nanoarchaeota archaeon]
MNIQRVKLGARITLYNGIYTVILGLFFLIFMKLNMKLNFNSITQLWGFFTRYSSNVAQIFYLFNALVGLLLISYGLTIIFMSYFIIKRKDKMAWLILFLSGITMWAGMLIISFFLWNLLLIALSLIGWSMFLIGSLLPIKFYLEKNYKEY